MRWTVLQISEPMLANIGAGLDAMARVAGYSIDSRTIRAGELFFAIHGPRHDGHDHVAAALERGALAAVVAESRARQFPDALRSSCLVVDDTLVALHQLARAKRELIEGLNGPDSVAVLNADDPLVAAFASHAPGRVLTYGIENAADYRAEAIEDRGALGSAFVLVENGRRPRLELALPGRHVISNAVGALAAASGWGIGAAEEQNGFRTLHAPAMRGELLSFSNGAALINDSYNSSPATLHAIIKDLAATPHCGRRILAAG